MGKYTDRGFVKGFWLCRMVNDPRHEEDSYIPEIFVITEEAHSRLEELGRHDLVGQSAKVIGGRSFLNSPAEYDDTQHKQNVLSRWVLVIVRTLPRVETEITNRTNAIFLGRTRQEARDFAEENAPAQLRAKLREVRQDMIPDDLEM